MSTQTSCPGSLPPLVHVILSPGVRCMTWMMWHHQLFTSSLRIMFQGVVLHRVEHLGFGKDVQFVNTKRLPSQSLVRHSTPRGALG